MSSEDHSASSSFAASKDHASAKGNQLVESGRPFNEVIEAGPLIVGRSATLSRVNHSASPSVLGNCNAPVEQVVWRRKPSNEVRPPYRAPNVMAPHMEFPQPNLHAYGTVPPQILLVPFTGNIKPSTSSSFQGFNVFPNASYCGYYYPTHSHAGCFVRLQDIYATQHSYFFNMRNRLLKQIEYYFSSRNLETNFYLKSWMDANGWVPISLIARFKRLS